MAGVPWRILYACSFRSVVDTTPWKDIDPGVSGRSVERKTSR